MKTNLQYMEKQVVRSLPYPQSGIFFSVQNTEKIGGMNFKSGQFHLVKRSLLSIFFTCCLIFPQSQQAWAKWDMEASLGIGIEYNDNIDFLPEDNQEEDGLVENHETEPPPDDIIYTAIPEFAVLWEDIEDSFSLIYRGRYERYQDDRRELERWHWGEANLIIHRTTPLRLEATDIFRTTPRRTDLPEEGVNRIQRNILNVQPSLFFPVDKTLSLGIYYSGEWETYPGEDDSDDISIHEIFLSAEKKWSPLWTSIVRIGGGMKDRSIGDDYDHYFGELELKYRFSRRLELEYIITAEQRDFKTADSQTDETGRYLLHNFSIVGYPLENSRVYLSYIDQLEDHYDGDTSRVKRGELYGMRFFRRDSFLRIGIFYSTRDYFRSNQKEQVWGPFLGVLLGLNNWLSIRGSSEWNRADYELETGDSVDDTIWAELAFVASLGNHWFFESGYGYMWRDSTSDERSFDQNRYWATVFYRF
jgi:hypothetical protein